MSRPLQVYLDDTDLKNLTRWARERKWTQSQAVRAVIRALTREDARRRSTAARPRDARPPAFRARARPS